jgi:acetoin utilization deacetylase AcuC-like enzyme
MIKRISTGIVFLLIIITLLPVCGFSARWEDWELGGDLGLGVASGSNSGRILSPVLNLTATRYLDNKFMELAIGYMFGNQIVNNYSSADVDPDYYTEDEQALYNELKDNAEKEVKVKMSVIPMTVNFNYIIRESFFVGAGVGLYHIFYKREPLGNYRANMDSVAGEIVKSPSTTALGFQQIVGMEIFPMSKNWSWFVEIIYSPKYEVDIGSHVFPTSKYRRIKEFLVNTYNLNEENFITPRPASPEEIMLVHTEKYVNDIKTGTLSYADEIQLELPYSKELAEAAFLCAGGTIMACENALAAGIGVHLGGGFHHAYPDHGEGFCVFNDIAIAAISTQKKVIIIDCDLHQGNGTARALKDNADVFTFSIHQQNNYPIYKEKSDLDIPLEDGCPGEKYNKLLRKSLGDILKSFKPDLAIYVAGSDTFIDDQLGGLSLNIEDLENRDRIVKEYTLDKQLPTVVVLAGGYANNIEDTVLIHSNTIKEFLGLEK